LTVSSLAASAVIASKTTPQHIYKMAASGSIPSFRISGSVRFDPDEVAAWLKEKQAPAAGSRRISSASVAA
jgi:excisionase family DNA binding protein